MSVPFGFRFPGRRTPTKIERLRETIYADLLADKNNKTIAHERGVTLDYVYKIAGTLGFLLMRVTHDERKMLLRKRKVRV